MNERVLPRRIVILGCGGAGKSVLARRLSKAMNAPAIILDDIWRPDWGRAQVPAFRETLNKLHACDRAWISDGNFALATFDLRLPRADLIIWLDRPRWQCALRATLRALRGGEGHKLKDLPKVLRFIWNFNKVNRPRIETARTIHAPNVPVIHLHGDRDIEAIVNSLRG